MVKKKKLLLLSIACQFLVSFIHILRASYHLLILNYRCFWICSSWTNLHTGSLFFLKQIFIKNKYRENSIKKSFKKLIDSIHVVEESSLSAENKAFLLFLLHLGLTSLQIRFKLIKSLKSFLIVVNWKQYLKIRPAKITPFITEIAFPKIWVLGLAVYKF